MLKERRMVAEQVAAALFEAEAAIDIALSKAAHLATTSPTPKIRGRMTCCFKFVSGNGRKKF